MGAHPLESINQFEYFRNILRIRKNDKTLPRSLWFRIKPTGVAMSLNNKLIILAKRWILFYLRFQGTPDMNNSLAQFLSYDETWLGYRLTGITRTP